MELIFEKSVIGRKLNLLPKIDVCDYTKNISEKRELPLSLPSVSEIDLSRHYTALAKRAHGVNCGFYPLGSCTMKYNPRIDEDMASLCGFSNVHPLQSESTVQGSLEVIYTLKESLCEITGMDDMTLSPAAGAHGEFTGLLLIKAYHKSKNDLKRNKIIVPDTAHGTNPASAAMAGFEVINLPSDSEGCVDIEALKKVCNDELAGLMLTNPNTVGIFDKNILEITKIVHEAGGLNYYDGANLNAVVGIVRPGDMGFDVIHLNLHKTFATPHGGGGPGSGPVGCKAYLAPFLPMNNVKCENGRYFFDKPKNTIGSVKAFYGNFLVAVKALTYVLTLGKEGIPEVAKNAVLNANYMRVKLSKLYDVAFDRICMHEFVLSLEKLKRETGVSALDVAKALLDYKMHPPTMYFPLLVHEALMIEPTETESKQTMDEAIKAFAEIYEMATTSPDELHSSPKSTVIGRVDEVLAARNPVLKAN